MNYCNCKNCNHEKVCSLKEEYTKFLERLKLTAEPKEEKFTVSVHCRYSNTGVTYR